MVIVDREENTPEVQRLTYSKRQQISQLLLYDYRPQQSCGKVMFLHLSVILFTWGVCQGDLPWTETPSDRDPPPKTENPLDRGTHMVMSGRYASYWNAFL